MPDSPIQQLGRTIHTQRNPNMKRSGTIAILIKLSISIQTCSKDTDRDIYQSGKLIT